jgi:ribosome-associated heat shock protein Hsp15
MTEVRVDRWLWAARLFKTRGAATEAVLGGRVHVNGVRVKPAKAVRTGDRLEVTVAGARRELVVLDVAEKRGSAAVAATLYEETPASVARREELALRRRLDALRRAQQRRGQPPR